MSRLDLSIVIVNWNTKDLLANCLNSIRKAAPKLNYKTIVIDNKSKDGSLEMVEKDFPECIAKNSGGNIGFGRASNMGAKLADADFVLFLNPDTEISAGALEKMVQKMKDDPSIGGLGCRIRNSNGTIQPLGIQQFPTPENSILRLFITAKTPNLFGKGIPLHDANKSGYVLKLFGACLLTRREVLEKVGAFDERFFMYCEDVDLCFRIFDAGWKLYYMSEVEILHLGACSSNQVPGAFSVLMGCESLGLYMRKYYGTFGEWRFRAVLLLLAPLRLAALFLLALPRALGIKVGTPDWAASVRKYVTISKWALGLQKPTIGN